MDDTPLLAKRTRTILVLSMVRVFLGRPRFISSQPRSERHSRLPLFAGPPEIRSRKYHMRRLCWYRTNISLYPFSSRSTLYDGRTYTYGYLAT